MEMAGSVELKLFFFFKGPICPNKFLLRCFIISTFDFIFLFKFSVCLFRISNDCSTCFLASVGILIKFRSKVYFRKLSPVMICLNLKILFDPTQLLNFGYQRFGAYFRCKFLWRVSRIWNLERPKTLWIIYSQRLENRTYCQLYSFVVLNG